MAERRSSLSGNFSSSWLLKNTEIQSFCNNNFNLLQDRQRENTTYEPYSVCQGRTSSHFNSILYLKDRSPALKWRKHNIFITCRIIDLVHFMEWALSIQRPMFLCRLCVNVSREHKDNLNKWHKTVYRWKILRRVLGNNEGIRLWLKMPSSVSIQFIYIPFK